MLVPRACIVPHVLTDRVIAFPLTLGRVLRQWLHGLDDQRHSRQQKFRVIKCVKEFCARRRAALKNSSLDIKQQVLQRVVDHVVLDDQH